MANYADPIAQNIEGVRQLIGSSLNKTPGTVDGAPEGVSSEHVDELELKMSDEELILLAKMREDKYRGYEAKIKPRQEAQLTYYLGRQKSDGPLATMDVPAISANILFEAEETFLPAALSKNPEPVVWCDDTTEGNILSKDVKTMLQYHADTLVLRRKLSLMTRHWSIYFLGVVKHGWDTRINDICTDVIQPDRLILDPDKPVDAYGDYEGEYIGERKEVTARKLVELFPKHKEYIVLQVEGKMGTKVTYTEWWSDEYCYYTFKDIVLDKSKNPHFNYPQLPQPQQDQQLQQDQQNQLPQEPQSLASSLIEPPEQIPQTPQQLPNHFAFPKKPYTFLSVFNLGRQPHDETGLIEQNIPNQRRITRRTEQIDYNLSRANNSDVFSEENFNQETAKQAAGGMAKGNPLLVPSGKPINEAILRLQAPAIGSEFFDELQVSKNDLRTIFGTEGITSQPPNQDETARGMILNQQFDSTRIGGGIGDALEQVADNIFNWWVQLYCVYYDEPHFAAIMGQMRAVEYITLTNTDLNKHVVVSVAPDSMKPKDEVSEMNEALNLFKMGVLDPKTLFTVLDFPDAQNTAENTVLWMLDKQSYLQLNFPDLAAKLQQAQAEAQQQAAAMGAANPEQATSGAPPGGAGGAGAAGIPSAAPPELSSEPASAALSNVPLPK